MICNKFYNFSKLLICDMNGTIELHIAFQKTYYDVNLSNLLFYLFTQSWDGEKL